jgi:hypothetical protein
VNSRQEERALRDLGTFLHGLSAGEGGAIAQVQILADSDAVTDAERRFLLERMLPEEYSHQQQARAWAARLGATHGDAEFTALFGRDLGLTAHLRHPVRTGWALTMLRFSEERVLHNFPRWSRRMREWMPDLAEMFEGIAADEGAHVALDHAIHRRWQAERPELARIHETLYRAARQFYPPIISRAVRRAWWRLEVVLDGRRPDR